MRTKKHIYHTPEVYSPLIDDFENMVKNCIFNRSISMIKEKPRVKWLGDRTASRLSPVLIRNKPHFLIYRDGRDVLISLTYHHMRIKFRDSLLKDFPEMMKKRFLYKKNPHYFKEHPKELLDNSDWVKEIARRWNYQINWINKDLEKIKGEEELKVHIIKYEDLHADIEGERNKMYNFLDLDPREALPLDEKTNPGFKREDPTSHYRKGIIGDWKNYFTKNVCKIFKEEAGQNLITKGYEKNMEWEGDLS